jgi:Rad52/22 family double-strand break repair protein
MGFSVRQLRALRSDLNEQNVRSRQSNGRELSYIEGWHAIAEANRIFGFDGWDRETVESRCLMSRETRGTFLAVYAAKVRITVRANGKTIVREGHGSGEGRGTSPGETHDVALKGAETDATKRALATFGKPFGLSLYLRGVSSSNGSASHRSQATLVEAQRNELKEKEAERAMVVEAAPILPVSDESTRAVAVIPGIDKSVLTFGAPRRLRDKEHLRFVASQPCLLCSRLPSDPHHLRFAQPVALGRKVSDEFTVPLCRTHHRQVHHSGNEAAWWQDIGIDALEIARALWQESHANNGRGSVGFEPKSDGTTRQSNPASEMATQVNAAPQLSSIHASRGDDV